MDAQFLNYEPSRQPQSIGSDPELFTKGKMVSFEPTLPKVDNRKAVAQAGAASRYQNLPQLQTQN